MIEKIIQKAEEYKNKHWSKNVTEMSNQRSFQQVKGIPHFYDNTIKEAYIAGATENGIQWHDLRKDPNDLPKNEGSYLVCMEFNYRHTYILNYGQDDYDDEEKTDWYDDESTHYPKEVIAWAEIPQFKE